MIELDFTLSCLSAGIPLISLVYSAFQTSSSDSSPVEPPQKLEVVQARAPPQQLPQKKATPPPAAPVSEDKKPEGPRKKTPPPEEPKQVSPAPPMEEVKQAVTEKNEIKVEKHGLNHQKTPAEPEETNEAVEVEQPTNYDEEGLEVDWDDSPVPDEAPVIKNDKIKLKYKYREGEDGPLSYPVDVVLLL